MLIKSNVYGFRCIENGESLWQIEDKVKENFAENSLILFIRNSINKELSLKSIQNYQYFRSSFSEQLTINSDNIIFERHIYMKPLRNYCKIYYQKLLREPLQIKENGGSDVVVLPLDEYSDIKLNRDEYREYIKQAIEKIDCFYGAGQFPILTLHIIKISNNEYYYYTISR